jgi:outer membrane protein TolC
MEKRTERRALADASRSLHIKPIAAALATLLLAGCATFSADGGMESVSATARARTGENVSRLHTESDIAAAHATTEQLLAKSLTADAAMRIALLNNRGLQASLLNLGIAETDFVQAGRLRNPGLSFSRLRNGEDVEIDRSVMFDLAGLLTMPVRRGIEQRRFEQAKLQAAAQAVRLARETRKAYFNAVAAQQSASYMEQVAESAEASAELARRMAKAGNWSKLEQAREEAFYAESMAQRARTRHNAVATREQLTRLMGLDGKDTGFTLPDRLPDVPKAPNEQTNLESLAMMQRLDIQMARQDTEATASALGLSRATGFINVLDAGYINKSQSGKPRANGYEVSLELPIFDWGSARVAKAEALYMQSVHRTADTAVRARSEVREAYSAYRTAWELATRYRDDIVPLRKKISDEVLLRYNGMLASVFELLADARGQIASVNAAIEAQRDFWLADTDLQAAVNGSGDLATTRIRTAAPALAD